MATEQRLMYMDDTMDKLRAYAERKHEAGHIELANGILKAVNYIRNNIVRVDAVEVVHGRWVDNHCTVCGMTPIGEETWLKHGMEPPNFEFCMDYCPCCGAMMDGGNDVQE